ncbi:hypothetical protein E2C01_016888 [Portunus trituberculatus]|uniref:Uncharacterized protein n=1 Tax=Portunus trituberculatus TaxID=210409 RepID=A0A5B7DS46_PORTR|nr:hypothetical protein [Portunus trituberculatus]
MFVGKCHDAPILKVCRERRGVKTQLGPTTLPPHTSLHMSSKSALAYLGQDKWSPVKQWTATSGRANVDWWVYVCVN